ncbi:MAG TPA: SMP-30/gluconolactonase/LRE family protein [Anaerolineales bacterium]
MSRKRKIIGIATALTALAVIIAFGIRASAVSAVEEVEIVKTFNAAEGQLPEGVMLDKSGNIFVTLGAPAFAGGGLGEVWKISPDGTETTILAEFDYPGVSGPAGIVIDAPGNVYFAYPATDPEINGVYRLENGNQVRLPGTENTIVANGLALDKHGDLFASDSVLGAIWRISPGKSGVATMWFQDDLLAGCLPDEPVGANGIAFWKQTLYVANTGKGLLVQIPILENGAPGEPEVVAGVEDNGCEFDDLSGMDGIALDVHGNVYALLVLQNKLVRINPSDGTFTTLLTEEDGLWNPASIVFGTGKGERESVFISNYAVIPPEPPNSLGPAVLKYNVGVPGLPIP